MSRPDLSFLLHHEDPDATQDLLPPAPGLAPGYPNLDAWEDQEHSPDDPLAALAAVGGLEIAALAGLLAPAGTPADISNKLSKEIATALQNPQVQSQLAASGYEPVGSTPQELGKHIDREIERWSAVVKATGARVE